SMNLGTSSMSLPDMRRMIEALSGTGALIAGTAAAVAKIRLDTTEAAFSKWIGGRGGGALELAEKRAALALEEGRGATKFVDKALLSGSVAFVGSAAFAIFVIVAAVVVIILGIIGQVEAAQLPIDLQKAIDNANASALPDLSAMENSTSPDGSNLL